MTETLKFGNLTVAKELDEFLRNEVVEGIGVDANKFWDSLESILDDFVPRNKELLKKREDIQETIDEWHLSRKEEPHDHEAYVNFLREINYLQEEGDDFKISTENVDDEIKTIAGAQLVVPVMNARFSLNAANARWGSLYDALYGTDMISEDNGAERGGAYNPIRGDKVIEFSKNFLDESVALSSGSYTE
ncbi:MAG TPA: malate synthase G, partial [SAR86 cluster bacterium]|nr:malate synthase G [SAR86 cluster bacterium]